MSLSPIYRIVPTSTNSPYLRPWIEDQLVTPQGYGHTHDEANTQLPKTAHAHRKSNNFNFVNVFKSIWLLHELLLNHLVLDVVEFIFLLEFLGVVFLQVVRYYGIDSTALLTYQSNLDVIPVSRL